MDVYMFVFEHRHGRDISAHSSAELAYADAAKIARRRLGRSAPAKRVPAREAAWR